MNKILFVIVFISTSIQSSAQDIDENSNSNQISIGVIDSLYSETLGEQRDFWIHVPHAYDDQTKFPVIFLLDGAYHFESVVGMMRYHSIIREIPEMIVVAIMNTNRLRDFSPLPVSENTNLSGAKEFATFIEKELVPYIDSAYPTIPYRTLFGHSLGGLFTVNMLVHHTDLFDNYLAIDPSLSYNQPFLEDLQLKFNKTDFENKALYIPIANTLRGNMTYEKALIDTTTDTRHLRSIVAFSELAKQNSQLVSEGQYFPNETHSTLPIIATHNAFRFFFSWYKFQDWPKFYDLESDLTGDELAALLISHHANVSDKLRYPYPPDEYEVNQLAYMFLSNGDEERAFPFFELNIQNYPESANAYDSMGDYYLGVSDTIKAIKYFSKSIELGGSDGTVEKLQALGKKN